MLAEIDGEGMGEQTIRFGITDGQGHRAATWKCWSPGGGKHDVYLACRELGGALHASLHQSGDWHIAFSRRFLEENLERTPDDNSDRFIDRWPRPREIAPGVTLAFRIVTPSSAVNTPFSQSPLPDVKWIPSASEDHATEIDLLITAPGTPVTGWPGRRSMGTRLIDSMVLETGEIVWAVYRVIEMPKLENVHGKARFFKGKSRADLEGRGLRVLLGFGHIDGSRAIYDCAAEVQGDSF